MAPLLSGRSLAAGEELGACTECGSPTTSDLCAFCRTAQKARAHDPVPVELVLSKGRRRR
jgi:recombinational DNA repair protein RecR